MGTIAEKGAYLNTTKSLLKQKINNLGGDITNQTTFRQYANQLQNVYDNIPKTSYAEGSNITLSNTLKGKLDFEDGIVGIGDTKQGSTTGKNKFAITVNLPVTKNGVTISRDNEGNIILNGTPNISSGTISFTVAENVDLNAGTYTLSLASKIAGVGLSLGDTNPSGALNITLSDTVRQKTGTITGFSSPKSYNINVRYDVGTLNNFILNPQLELGSGATDYEKYTNGIASPNPNNPQDIEVVRGKNILDISKIVNSGTLNGVTCTVNDDTISFSGTATGNGIIAYIPITLEKGTYTFSFEGSAKNTYNTKSIITLRSNTNAWVQDLYSTETYASGTINVTEKTTYRVSFNIVVGYTYNNTTYNLKPMLEKGSQATSYLPYNTIEVVERGKNLFDGTLYNGQVGQQGGWSENSQRVSNISADGQIGNFLLEAGTYTLSVEGLQNCTLLTKNASGTILDNFATVWQTLPFTFTLTQEGYVSFTARKSDNSNISPNDYNAQIEQGSTATTYEPYQTPQTYQLSLGEYEFAKIGNYVDTIEYDVDEDKVYKNENIGKVNLKDISWTYDAIAKRIYGAIGNGFIPQASGSELAYLVCTHYSVKPFDTFYGATTQTGIANGNGSANISLRNANYTSRQEYINEFTNNNEKLYYAKTSQDIEITTTLKDQIKALYNSHSFTGTTIIEIDGQLPLIIKVRANSEGIVPSGSISINSNGTHDVTNYATANVNVTPSTETKTVKSTTTSQTINPTSGKLISQITVQPIILNTVNVTPSTSSQTITPTNDGIGQVNVNAVTSSIDNNIVAENIKKDVSILGVTGTYEGGGSSEYNAKVNNPTDTYINVLSLISEISSLDTSNATNLQGLFNGCFNLIKIPLIDTSNCTNARDMFRGCISLTVIPSLNTSKVTNMMSMFQQCTNITTIPLINTSKATNTQNMFQQCSSLTTVPVLDLSSATDLRYMFQYCASLSDDSINNILAMCINATSYTGNKTLTNLGLNSTQKSKASTLSNWNAFVEAGWSA